MCIDSAGVGLGAQSRDHGELAWFAAFVTVRIKYVSLCSCLLVFLSFCVDTVGFEDKPTGELSS